VTWNSIPKDLQNGILWYRIYYKKSDSSAGPSNQTEVSKLNVTLSGLEKFTKYDIEVVGVTSAGEGKKSKIQASTDEDGKLAVILGEGVLQYSYDL